MVSGIDFSRVKIAHPLLDPENPFYPESGQDIAG